MIASENQTAAAREAVLRGIEQTAYNGEVQAAERNRKVLEVVLWGAGLAAVVGVVVLAIRTRRGQ